MTALADPERQLALSYAPFAARAPLALLWRLDERLGAIVAAAREPAIGAMRLLWWRDALIRLDDPGATVPAEPLLTAIAELLIPAGLSGTALSEIEEGWSVLLDDPEPAADAIGQHGAWRGGRLFTLSAQLLGAADLQDMASAGEGWALADLGHRLSTGNRRMAARRAAAATLADITPAHWPRALRPLGLLVLLAKRDAAMPADRLRHQGSPARVMRSLAYRLFGR